VQAIFKTPIGTGRLEQSGGRNLFPGYAGKAINHMLLEFTGLGERETPFQFIYLLEVRPGEKIFEFGCSR
jgi:hypothetical protein